MTTLTAVSVRTTSEAAAMAAALVAARSWKPPHKNASTSRKHATNNENGNNNENSGGNKRALPSEDAARGNETTNKRQRDDKKSVIDLSDVPPQPPIPKSAQHMREGSSKYAGVTFNKRRSKWEAGITIDYKQHHIGFYETEEEAATDYARAVFKYKGQQALDKVREQKTQLKQQRRRINAFGRTEERVIPTLSVPIIHVPQSSKPQSSNTDRKRTLMDLSGVPPQLPIPKSKGRIKEGASKYAGVSFDKGNNKWKAAIKIEGKKRQIGCYENEEEAAADYARAVLKYKGQGALDMARGKNSAFDLSDVPPQPPILRSADRAKNGSSKYAGISWEKATSKWRAKIMIEGHERTIGLYENEEEAAIDYARTVFKYKGQWTLQKASERNKARAAFIMDLSDVPPQPPVPKSKGKMKEGASKYTGVSFLKDVNKWQAQIELDGKRRYIGCYENEEAAGIDYARAVFKFKGQEALNNLREQNSSGPEPAIDLSDVPPKQPILKSAYPTKEGSSRYTGVYFNKSNNKWETKIWIEGKLRSIGYYENEEEAAIDYARAAFKYKKQKPSMKSSSGGWLPRMI